MGHTNPNLTHYSVLVMCDWDVALLDFAHQSLILTVGLPEEECLLKLCFQGLEIIRGCRGLNLVGCDLVEVSPPYDTTGTVLH